MLLVLGVVLFALETQVVSHGLLAAGGIVCFLLGASALYTVPGDPLAPVIGVAPPVIGVATITTAVIMGVIAIGAARSRRMKGSVGTVGVPVPTGTTGVVQAPLGPVGTVHLGGETWTARTPDETPLERNTPVRLIGFEGLVALVVPLGPDETPTIRVAPAPLPADIS